MVLSISFSLFQRVTHHIIQFFKLTQWFKLASLQQSTNIENQDKATTISIWNTLKSKNKFNIHIHTNNSVHTLLTVVTPSCANCIWQGGTCPPPFYKWLDKGAPRVNEQQSRNWPNCTVHHESARQKRLIVLVEPKKWSQTKKSGALRLPCAPPLHF